MPRHSSQPCRQGLENTEKGMKKLKPADLPSWPRRMGADLASAYMGVSPSLFLLRVKQGKYPQPVKDGRLSLWDRKTLESIVDAQFGKGDTSSAYKSW